MRGTRSWRRAGATLPRCARSAASITSPFERAHALRPSVPSGAASNLHTLFAQHGLPGRSCATRGHCLASHAPGDERRMACRSMAAPACEACRALPRQRSRTAAAAIAATLAQRQHAQPHHVEAVEQIGAEIADGDPSSIGRLLVATTCRSTARGRCRRSAEPRAPPAPATIWPGARKAASKSISSSSSVPPLDASIWPTRIRGACIEPFLTKEHAGACISGDVPMNSASGRVSQHFARPRRFEKRPMLRVAPTDG